jgi:8-oxo-dGTP pyrophosphatase MutT (NUDIX family)
MSDNLPPTIPAATLILFDESEPGPARHIMLERSAGMTFAAGMLVFPGGRVEPEDDALAAMPSLLRNPPADVKDAAGRIAAIRETLEESGIAVAIRPTPTAETISFSRAALKQRQPFAPLLAAGGHSLDLGLLTPFSRWIPNLKAPRRFDTRFYIARGEGVTAAIHDEDEATRHVWLTAAGALEDQQAGRHDFLFPTMCNLARLAEHPSFSAVQDHLQAVQLQTMVPEIREIDGKKYISIPEDAGYPITRAPISSLKP